MISAPTLGWRYWTVLCFASVLGANLGDVLSRELGLGYWRGLPVLAVLFVGVTLAARFSPRSTAWYWLAIVLVRAAATNLSDWQVLNEGEPPTVRSPLSFPIVIVVWSVVLACLALRERRAQDRGPARTDLWFWTTMLAAGTLGTAVGDWLGFQSGLELTGATVLMTVSLGVAFLGLSRRSERQVFAFWALVLAIRTWGTNVGDLLADTAGLWQGFAISVSVTALMVSYLSRRGPARPAAL